MRLCLGLWAALILSVLPQSLAAQSNAYPVAVLQGLDKITARVTTLEIPIDETVKFGTLVISARHCDKRPPTETPESTIFLEISDQQPGEEARRIFTGWMFASSPGLNSLEHPVYDVWALDCRKSSTKDQSSPSR